MTRDLDTIRADYRTATHGRVCSAAYLGAVVDCGHGLNVRLIRAAIARLVNDVPALLADAESLAAEFDGVGTPIPPLPGRGSPGTVDGIRPHRPMTPTEAAQARAAAETIFPAGG